MQPGSFNCAASECAGLATEYSGRILNGVKRHRVTADLLTRPSPAAPQRGPRRAVRRSHRRDSEQTLVSRPALLNSYAVPRRRLAAAASPRRCTAARIDEEPSKTAAGKNRPVLRPPNQRQPASSDARGASRACQDASWLSAACLRFGRISSAPSFWVRRQRAPIGLASSTPRAQPGSRRAGRAGADSEVCRGWGRNGGPQAAGAWGPQFPRVASRLSRPAQHRSP